MKKMYVGNLPPEESDQSIRELFSKFGTVRSLKVAADVFSGRCKGFAFVEMEGHEARAAVQALDGKDYHGNRLKVRFDAGRGGRGRGRR